MLQAAKNGNLLKDVRTPGVGNTVAAVHLSVSHPDAAGSNDKVFVKSKLYSPLTNISNRLL